MLVFEKIVPKPGIVKISHRSEDPTFFKPTGDLYNLQCQGIPEEFGKKNPRTTEQAYFVCKVCHDLEMSSIKTLQLHTRGSQHINNVSAFEARQEREKTKIEPSNDDLMTKVREASLPKSSDTELGVSFLLEYVPESQDGNLKALLPIYFCMLKPCKVFRGNTEAALAHIQSFDHLEAVKERKMPLSRTPLTVYSCNDHEMARSNQIPDSFYLQQQNLPKASQVKSEPIEKEVGDDLTQQVKRHDAALLPLTAEVDSPHLLRSESESLEETAETSAFPSSDSSPFPPWEFSPLPPVSIRAFDQELETFVTKTVDEALKEKNIYGSERSERLAKLLKMIKVAEKTRHLRKGLPMDLIQFDEGTRDAVTTIVHSYIQSMQ